MAMSNITVQEESGDIIYQVWELAKVHYYEVETKSATIPFKLDIGLLEQLSSMGLLSIVTARDGGELVGYFANMISPDVITSKLISKELGIYLAPEYRGSGAFPKMVELVEQLAKEKGVYSQVLAFKEGHDFGIAQKLGYEKTETLYQKILEE